MVDEELETGVRSIAAPLCDRSGECIAALNVGSAAARAPVQRMLDACLPALREAARKPDRDAEDRHSLFLHGRSIFDSGK